MPDLNPQQFLPGTEAMRPAEPHEQTEAQFHNRPDVMVHGRFVGKDRLDKPGLSNQMRTIPKYYQGFHSGSEKAAEDRVGATGPAFGGYSPTPRFFHGQVKPELMHNLPTEDENGRDTDQDEDWDVEHHNRFYMNAHEDTGSTSAIHSVGETGPHNFKTWRQSVTEAKAAGQKVPSHVQAVYDATGGEAGPHHVLHPDLERHLRGAMWTTPKERRIPAHTTDPPMFSQFHGSSNWYVTDTLTKDNPNLNRGSLG